MLTPMHRVTSPNSRTVLMACLVGALCSAVFSSMTAMASERSTDATARQKFQLAVKELRSGAGPRYQSLRQELADYPLAIYLDALVIEGNLHYTTSAQMQEFMQQADDSPLAMRTLRSFVRHKVKDRRWREIIQATDRLYLSTELSCHRAHALLKSGQTDSAIPLLNDAWSVGKSQIKACDPVFKAWFKHSGPTDDIIWERALKAADARNSYLLRYLQRFASKTLKQSLADLAEIYRRPDRVTQGVRGSADRQRDIGFLGIKRLARVNPGKAHEALQTLSRRFEFTPAQQTDMNGLIVRHSLFAKSAAPESWVRETLVTLAHDELTEIYLRAQVEVADWPRFREGFEWLSAERKRADEWQYWRAIAAGPGEAEFAQVTFERLSNGRGFHAYLAAVTLDSPPTLGDSAKRADSVSSSGVLASSVPIVQRVRELLALEREWEARTEFRAGLNDKQVALSLAELASAVGRHSWAIEAAAAAGAWGRIDLRFPIIFEDEFKNASQESGLPVTALMAVARRESALSPVAVSEAGARGLMQLMPSTARLTARKHNYRYSRSRLMRPGYNTAVGALYFADLVDNYGGNRVLALAAYNAGPNRVRRWREGDLSVARWVDTIPFKETREYVRAVLAYNVIYSLKAGRDVEFLTAAELASNY